MDWSRIIRWFALSAIVVGTNIFAADSAYQTVHGDVVTKDLNATNITTSGVIDGTRKVRGFKVTSAGTEAAPTSSTQKLLNMSSGNGGAADFDTDSFWSPSTDVATIPVGMEGIWTFCAQVNFQGIQNVLMFLRIESNTGQKMQSTGYIHSLSFDATIIGCTTLEVAAGDTYWVTYQVSATAAGGLNETISWFSGIYHGKP